MARPKKYLVNGEPVDWRELIQCALDAGMISDWINTTSDSADFLRAQGATVEENPEFKDESP